MAVRAGRDGEAARGLPASANEVELVVIDVEVGEALAVCQGGTEGDVVDAVAVLGVAPLVVVPGKDGDHLSSAIVVQDSEHLLVVVGDVFQGGCLAAEGDVQGCWTYGRKVVQGRC